jgi:5-methylcytosine-specific restriction endonuclease McrA
MTKFYEGTACSKCGGTTRYTSTRQCVPCKKAIPRYEDRDTQKYRDLLESSKQWKRKNKAAQLKYMRNWREENKESIKEYMKEYRQQNKERKREVDANRRAAKLNATPKWVDRKELRRVYEECPEGMEVDHIIPLKGATVSGLHVPWNLQYLTKSENSAKGNRF